MWNKSKKTFILIIISFACLFLFSCATKEESDYSYTIKIIKAPNVWYSNEVNTVVLEIMNTGKIPWVVTPKNTHWRVRASYHIFDESGAKLIVEGLRTDFRKTIKPSQKVRLLLNVQAPLSPGIYQLRIDLLKENHFWFESQGSVPYKIKMDVKDIHEIEHKLLIKPKELRNFYKFVSEEIENSDSEIRFSTPYPEINQTVKLVKRTYDKNIIKHSTNVFGFAAGSNYPEVWLRDSYYHLRSSRYFFPFSCAKKVLTGFFERLAETGNVPDCIFPDGKTKSFSASVDRNALIVLGACEYILLSGDYDWLDEKVGNTTVYNLLHDSSNILSEYLDKKTGLYFSAHTADWGDVEFEDEGEDALFLGNTSHRVAGIYHQSLFYAVKKRWSEILFKIGRLQDSTETEFRADRLKQQTDKFLWQSDKGFYRIHHHLDSLTHSIDEDDIFALGGNIWAIRVGMADSQQAASILRNIRARQNRRRWLTISKVLDPPYPDDFFKHEALRRENCYQNGGYWDWYGAMTVVEQFRSGRSAEALGNLRALCHLVSKTKNLPEWYDQAGKPHGSMHYLATGAMLLEAVMEGYFGLRLDQKWIISPAFTKDNKTLFFKKKDENFLVAYNYRTLNDRGELIIKYHVEGLKTFTWKVPLEKTTSKQYSRKYKNKKEYYFNRRQGRAYFQVDTPAGEGEIKIVL